MKKFFGILMMMMAVVLMTFTVSSCTENIRAKNWGGKMTYELSSDQKLVNVTWKDSDMWVLTRPMRPDEVAETYKFTEKSAWGVMKGEITFVETKTIFGLGAVREVVQKE